MKVEYQTDASEHLGVSYSAMDIDHNKKAKMIALMTVNMYKNPPEAIVRELCSNAYDANLMAGDSSKPIWITIPTFDNPYLRIWDEAIGLNQTEAESTLFTILGSEKDHSDDFIGGWGLGAKSPIAYATEYEVYTRKDGTQWEFHVTKAPNGLNHHAMFQETPWDGPNGVEFRVPVKINDLTTWRQVISKYVANTNYNVQVTNPEQLYYLHRGKELFSFDVGRYSCFITDHEGKSIYVRYGGFLYEVTSEGLEGDAARFLKFWSAMSSRCLIIDVSVSEISFVPSRDSIELSKKTLDYLSGAFEAIVAKLRDNFAAVAKDEIDPVEDFLKLTKEGDQPLRDIADKFYNPNKEQTDDEVDLSSSRIFKFVNWNSFANHFIDQSDRRVRSSTQVPYRIPSDEELNFLPPLRSGKFEVLGDRLQAVRFSFPKTRNTSYRRASVSIVPSTRAYNVDVAHSVVRQVFLIWGPKKISQQKHVIEGSDYDFNFEPDCSIFNIIADDEQQALDLAIMAGFPDSVIDSMRSYEQAGIEERVFQRSGKRAAGSRKDKPTYIQCFSDKTRHNYRNSDFFIYCQEGDSVYWSTTDLTELARFLVKSKILSKFNPSLPPSLTESDYSSSVKVFCASNSFLKRSSDLPNVLHWSDLLGAKAETLKCLLNSLLVLELMSEFCTSKENLHAMGFYENASRVEVSDIVRMASLFENSLTMPSKSVKKAVRHMEQVVAWTGIQNLRRDDVEVIAKRASRTLQTIVPGYKPRQPVEVQSLLEELSRQVEKDKVIPFLNMKSIYQVAPDKLYRIYDALEKEMNHVEETE